MEKEPWNGSPGSNVCLKFYPQGKKKQKVEETYRRHSIFDPKLLAVCNTASGFRLFKQLQLDASDCDMSTGCVHWRVEATKRGTCCTVSKQSALEFKGQGDLEVWVRAESASEEDRPTWSGVGWQTEFRRLADELDEMHGTEVLATWWREGLEVTIEVGNLGGIGKGDVPSFLRDTNDPGFWSCDKKKNLRKPQTGEKTLEGTGIEIFCVCSVLKWSQTTPISRWSIGEQQILIK